MSERRRASSRLVGHPNSTWGRRLASLTLDSLPPDALLRILRQLDGKALGRLEMVCTRLAAPDHGSSEPSLKTTLMEVAAKELVQASDRAVSFQPQAGESWKHLLSLIDAFRASRGRSNSHNTCNHLFSKKFISFWQGYPGCPQPIDYAFASVDGEKLKRLNMQLMQGLYPTADPDADLVAHLQKAAANGCAPAQYALGCHHEIGAGVPKDPARARDLYRSSAELGCTFGQEALMKLDDPSNGHNIEDRPVSFNAAMEDENCYHPLANKKWMDTGATDAAESIEHDWSENTCDKDDSDQEYPPDPDYEYRRGMEDAAAAFIGNSIAFHMGGGTRDRDIKTDGIHTSKNTIVFEVRSARGVLTVGEVYRAIQGTVWMNHQWYKTLFHEGFEQVRFDYRTQDAGSDEPTLEAASGAPSADGPIGGRVSAQELKRLEDAGATIVGSQRCAKYGWYKSTSHLSEQARKCERRCSRAEWDARMQNDFAAVGAGPNRFKLHWGS